MHQTGFLGQDYTSSQSIGDLTGSTEISYSLIGLVAKENPNYKSGYEIAEHINGNITLVIVDTITGSRQYISLDLGQRKPEGTPGINLIEYIKENYPDLGVLVTGRKLAYQDSKIKNEIEESGGDIEKTIEKYIGSQKSSNAKKDSDEGQDTKSGSETKSKGAEDSDGSEESAEGSGEEGSSGAEGPTEGGGEE
ncbi:MAG: hypothetical protein KKC75_01825 [Nanoarchaeota archaeon]|nr:hypothetical protein [Nanoarchaeota archaeon]MBU1005726.1 hypothetical protein [Nanoarchaeota archaeon]MBU1945589.1 hypothetical protein [Nanoarchaeota archaeon]